MNISSGINTYSANLKVTQLSEMKTALQLQEQALENAQTATPERNVPVSTERGSQVDVSI